MFSAGDVITFIRSTGDATNGTIDVSAVTCYSSADGTTTNRTIAARGMATMICTSPNYFYISGAGMT